MLKADNLTKRFAGLIAVDNVSFQVEEGNIVGIIGPNGAGKTTLLNLISGTYSPSSGKIFYDGKDTTGFSPHRLCVRGIARTYQHPRPFANHTVLQNVMIGALFGRGTRRSEREAEEEALKQLSIVELDHRRDAKAAGLNHIELKRMELARALAANPKLLLLDEPAAGLNPIEVNSFIDLIRNTNKSGKTIILIEHILKAVMALSDRVLVLDYGKLLAEGRPEEIVKNKQVIEAYLGE